MAEALPPDPLIGEIRLFAGNFAPKNWALCDGRLLNIRDYPRLYTLMGTAYGGDGVNTFGVPNLQSRVPVHEGPGFVPGQMGGVEKVTLTTDQLPKHVHPVSASRKGDSDIPEANVWATARAEVYADIPGDLSLNQAALANYGDGREHENRIPFLAINYIIALQGALPESES